MSIYRAREAKDVRTFGSARWADPHEIASAGLLGDDGVVLGKLDRNYLRHDGAEHVLCFAPTRAEGRRSGGADAADLARLLDRP
jgi:type IV secretion system protein VirD4